MAAAPGPSTPDTLATLFLTFARDFPSDNNVHVQRAIYDQVHTAATECPNVTYSDTTIPSLPDSKSTHNIPCKWIRPLSASTSHVILFFHGGGYSFGSPNGHRKLAAHIASAALCVLLSVDYRRAPECVYPAALDDCVAAYAYLLSQGYAAKHIAFVGDSCGGCLATAVAIAAVRKGMEGPAASVSLSPLYDQTGTIGVGSRDENEVRDVLNTKAFVEELARRYVGTDEGRRRESTVSPLWASEEEVRGLPPHWISVGGWDMLRDDGVRMAERLREQGVKCVLEVQEGKQHVMEFEAGKNEAADGSIRRFGEWLQEKQLE